ncbi:MAG: SDR family NAD(P)-dependent oxidoreductase, partial [Planctomycetota bacterium]
KREFVREAGASAVMNSRSLQFATEILEATHGEGVDVVLNSLPGEAITKGLSVLRTGGRFLEIGKRDIYADTPLGLEPFRNNLAFFAIDLDQLIRETPQRIGDHLRDLAQRFESGELKSLPVTTFASGDVKSAFRFMQQAQHIGKVIVDFQDFPADLFLGKGKPFQAKRDRTYWVAGGLGGFGWRVVEWLIDCGAKHIVVGGRSKTLDSSTIERIESKRTSGVSIRFVPVDLSDSAAVSSAVEVIQASSPPLAGIFHTAMVLEDSLIDDLTRQSLDSVLRPKVQGGWNLHNATTDLSLEHFVLFSSLSSIFGHAGQANYAAANAWLDALGHYRRAIGMPASVINWGHVGNVGYLAQREELSHRLERQGVLAFTDEEAMSCLDRMLGSDATQLGVLRMDWSIWRGLGITGRVSPRFAGLLQGQRQKGEAEEKVSPNEIRSAARDERPSLICDCVCAKIAALLGMEAEQLPLDQPLLSLGLDSLMAVEIRNWVENQLKVDLPIATLMQGQSLTEVCDAINQAFEDQDHEPECSLTNGLDADDLLERLPELTDTDVDSLLTELMGKNEGDRSRE